jgi:hypothetical protein
MTNLRRRLKKLEASFTDATGLAPHSPAWTEHWNREIDRVLAEPEYRPNPLIPLEAIRDVLQVQP